MTAHPPDPARWRRLSPLLDDLLERDEAGRAQRLSALRADDAALADELAALLARDEALERDGFLERPAALHLASAGQRVGAYTLEREIGHGGMGSVWLAHRTDGRFEGRVAIKFLNPLLVARGGAERFAREGHILARLAHPNIARLLDAGVLADGTQPYLVLEYVDGVPIDRHCDTHQLDLLQRVRLVLAVLSAVTHAHSRAILHRDLKPSNILVTPAGEVKLLDFGVAKLLDGDASGATEITQVAGRAYTLHYAAPEQLQDGDVTTATDVYAMGVLLYVVLGGGHPTAGSTTAPLDQMRAVVEHQPQRLSDAVARDGSAAALARARTLRGDLDNIVAKALKKAPAERYANAAELADDLQRFLRHEPVTARPDSRLYVLGKFVRRHRLAVGVATAVTATLAGALGIALQEGREAQQQRVQAEGLIEFMLGDLRTKLEPVGRLDVLDSVGTRALAYYASQGGAGGLDAGALGRRARALHLIGEIAEQRGQLDEAQRVFQQAADTTAELMGRAPGDAQRVFDHAQSIYWVGYVARRRGQADAAEQAFRQYQALADQLAVLEPGKPAWRTEQAYAGQNLGVLLLERGRAAEALTAFEGTHRAWIEVGTAQPDAGFEQANTLGWIAKARESIDDFAGAVAAQREKIDRLARLPEATTDRRVQRLTANAQYEIGRLHLMLGQTEAATTATAAAAHTLAALVAADPSNADWLQQLTFARVSYAEALLAAGRHDAARRELAQTERAMQSLLAGGRDQPKRAVSLHGRWLLLQHALADRAARAGQARTLAGFVDDALRIEAQGRALDAEQARVVAAAQLALGDALAAGADRDGARRHWQAAADRLRASAAQGHAPALALLAHAQARLDQPQDARALLARVEASSYRHPVVADLRQRLAAATGSAPAR